MDTHPSLWLLVYTEQANKDEVSQYTELIDTHAHPLIDGLDHATRSVTVPVCRSRTQLFQKIRPFIFQAGVVLKPLVSLTGRLVACSARISVDRQTDRQTERLTLAAHARRWSSPCQTLSGKPLVNA